jgi:hypothetical protein
MHKNINRGPIDNTAQRTEELDRAVERVYRYYENDLSAFIRDVQRDIAKNAEPMRSNKSSQE